MNTTTSSPVKIPKAAARVYLGQDLSDGGRLVDARVGLVEMEQLSPDHPVARHGGHRVEGRGPAQA